MIGNEFLLLAKLARFSGPISYNSNGYAVLPPYTISNIRASIQPTKTSKIKFEKEGTRYADYQNFLSDFFVQIDNKEATLGDYFIFDNNKVYKILTQNNYLPFGLMAVNHCEGAVVRDNRLTFDGTSFSLPYPQLEGPYGPIFACISIVTASVTSISLPVLWSCQQELQPPFPYCAVSIDAVENLEIATTQALLYSPAANLQTSSIKQLYVRYGFYAYDQVQAVNLREEFKLNFAANNIVSDVLVANCLEDNLDIVVEKLYEDRTIFAAECVLKYSWTVIETDFSADATATIETVLFTLNVTP